MAAKTDVRSTLTEIFLKSIEEDPLSWHSNFKSPQRPMNGIYHNQYKGYNRMLLLYVMNKNGYQDPRFYPQSYIFGSPENREKAWDDPTKIKVMRGEKPVFIDTGFFVPKNKFDADGNKLKPISIPEYRNLPDEKKELYRPAQKSIPVYNADQLTGVEKWKEIENGKQVLDSYILQVIDRGAAEMGVAVKEGDYDPPCYIPVLDEIHMPQKSLFANEYAFAATMLHEMAHASGAEHRMNRDLSGGFGSEKYAIEELRAEIASAFMANEFGIDMPDSLLDDHKAYVQSWAKAISNDKNILISAIFDAEKIADYVEDKAELTKWIQLQQEADKKDDTISKSIDMISDRYDKSTALLMENLENIRYKLNGDSVAMMVNAMEFSIRNLGDLTPDLKKLEQQPDRDECRNISDIFESINQSRISWLDKIQKYISDSTIVKKIDDIKTGITNDTEYEKRLFIRLESQITDTVEPDTIEQYDCKWSRERFVELDPPQDLYNLSRVKLTCLESNNPNYKKGDVLAFADSEYQLINPDYNISVRDLNKESIDDILLDELKGNVSKVRDFDRENIDEILLEESTDRDFNDWVSEAQPKFHTKGLTSNLNQPSVIEHSQDIDKG